jgi:hypothetical protein
MEKRIKGERGTGRKCWGVAASPSLPLFLTISSTCIHFAILNNNLDKAPFIRGDRRGRDSH